MTTPSESNPSTPMATRRSFVARVGMATASIAVLGCEPGQSVSDGDQERADAEALRLADIRDALELPEGPVDVVVDIKWMSDDSPVSGANVLDEETNELLGTTGEDGTLELRVPNGSILRLVEPEYGQQQALRLVQGERRLGSDIRAARVGEGWTIN